MLRYAVCEYHNEGTLVWYTGFWCQGIPFWAGESGVYHNDDTLCRVYHNFGIVGVFDRGRRKVRHRPIYIGECSLFPLLFLLLVFGLSFVSSVMYRLMGR